jgi:hypothetical protein
MIGSSTRSSTRDDPPRRPLCARTGASALDAVQRLTDDTAMTDKSPLEIVVALHIGTVTLRQYWRDRRARLHRHRAGGQSGQPDRGVAKAFDRPILVRSDARALADGWSRSACTICARWRHRRNCSRLPSRLAPAAREIPKVGQMLRSPTSREITMYAAAAVSSKEGASMVGDTGPRLAHFAEIASAALMNCGLSSLLIARYTLAAARSRRSQPQAAGRIRSSSGRHPPAR